MAEVIGDTTCNLHPDRLATARCPSCGGFFCAECITEHDGKLTCASCLSVRIAPLDGESSRRRIPIVPVVQLLCAVAICWLLFFIFAQTLGDIPDEFHDGTIWE